MKYFSLLFLLFATVCSSVGQTIYESLHVKDGKTMQLTIPEEYYKVDNTVDDEMEIYCSQKGIDIEVDHLESMNLGTVLIVHIPTNGESLLGMKDQLENRFDNDEEITKIIQRPVIEKINGHDCMNAGFKSTVIGDLEGTTFFSLIEFGDYFIMITYSGPENLEESLSFKQFKAIGNSLKLINTNKEDGFASTESENLLDSADEVSEGDYKSLGKYFPNDLFQTNIRYYDIFPGFSENWKDFQDESGHLLSMYSYKNDNGFLKIFSGGPLSNYPSEEEMADAIELAMDWTKDMSLEHNAQFSNEDHVFELYTISGGGTMSSVYTTIANRELVFFVVDGGTNPVEDFKPAVRDLMLTMWVDFPEAQGEAVQELIEKEDQ